MADAHQTDAVLAMGEVHTAILRSSAALALSACERLLGLADGERVLRFERPIAHVVSPRLLTGVDCRPASLNGARGRVVGTVAGRASITGGHVVQGSAMTQVVLSAAKRRLGWAHYLTRPGCVELIGKPNPADLAHGFFALTSQPDVLDLGAIGARMVNGVQSARLLDGTVPVRVERTRLRWVAWPDRDNAVPTPLFRVERDGLRTLVVRGAVESEPVIASIAEFAADLALHDWLLTALTRQIERSRLGLDDRPTVIARLGPAVDHLLHLWMPAARGDDLAAAMWASLERRPGLSRQWQSMVNRVRDQLALGSIAALSDRLGETVV
jgi:hypothetical protein